MAASDSDGVVISPDVKALQQQLQAVNWPALAPKMGDDTELVTKLIALCTAQGQLVDYFSRLTPALSTALKTYADALTQQAQSSVTSVVQSEQQQAQQSAATAAQAAQQLQQMVTSITATQQQLATLTAAAQAAAAADVIDDGSASAVTTFSSTEIERLLQTLSTTLQNALLDQTEADARYPQKLHNHSASQITIGTFNHARIPRATASGVGGIKVRLSGTTAYITTNGANA